MKKPKRFINKLQYHKWKCKHHAWDVTGIGNKELLLLKDVSLNEIGWLISEWYWMEFL